MCSRNIRFILCLLGVFLCFLLLSAKQADATRAISISTNKSTLFGFDEMVINASMSGFTNGETIYVKGAFYKDGTSNYFGFTKNGNNWVKNGDTTTSQRQVTVGNWDGNITVKSDFDDGDYKGEGDYKVKLGFYYLTSGGNLSSVNWSSNSVDVAINNPDPTSTPIPTPTNTPVPPTATPKPTATPTTKPTATAVPKPTITKVLDTESPSPESSEVVTPSPVLPTTEVLGTSTSRHINFFPVILIVVSILLFGICGTIIFLEWKKSRPKI